METRNIGFVNNSLSKLVSCIECTIHGDISDLHIHEMQCDSRRVTNGDLFCCVSGTEKDGHLFAATAQNNGAIAVMCEKLLDDITVPQIVVKDTRIAMALMSAEINGRPADKMKMVGVTGTNGKTSTTYMIKSICEYSGKVVGVIGTINILIGDRIIPAEHTTPDSLDLHRILRQMYEAGVDIVVMEVSSHSLDQNRVYGIQFDVAIFTNLTQDHLDYHKTFENYFNAKKKLFCSCDVAVVNADDEHSETICSDKKCPVLTFGICKKSDVYAKDIEILASGVEFSLHRGSDAIDVSVPITGLFTIFNALGASGAALALGFTMEQVSVGLANMKGVSGRFESLPTHGRPFHIILDYAHTPDALENILRTAKGFAKGRIVTVFGCGGNRDNNKRPKMGRIAGKLSDFCVVTSDNPRFEEPMAIIDEVLVGVVESGCDYTVIENRRNAIEFAITTAKDNDVIILAGKGHESYQDICGIKYDFDEKEIVEEILSDTVVGD